MLLPALGKAFTLRGETAEAQGRVRSTQQGHRLPWNPGSELITARAFPSQLAEGKNPALLGIAGAARALLEGCAADRHRPVLSLWGCLAAARALAVLSCLVVISIRAFTALLPLERLWKNSEAYTDFTVFMEFHSLQSLRSAWHWQVETCGPARVPEPGVISGTACLWKANLFWF